MAISCAGKQLLVCLHWVSDHTLRGGVDRNPTTYPPSFF